MDAFEIFSQLLSFRKSFRQRRSPRQRRIAVVSSIVPCRVTCPYRPSLSPIASLCRNKTATRQSPPCTSTRCDSSWPNTTEWRTPVWRTLFVRGGRRSSGRGVGPWITWLRAQQPPVCARRCALASVFLCFQRKVTRVTRTWRAATRGVARLRQSRDNCLRLAAL